MKILIIEDEKTLAESLKVLLETKGFEVELPTQEKTFLGIPMKVSAPLQKENSPNTINT